MRRSGPSSTTQTRTRDHLAPQMEGGMPTTGDACAAPVPDHARGQVSFSTRCALGEPAHESFTTSSRAISRHGDPARPAMPLHPAILPVTPRPRAGANELDFRLDAEHSVALGTRTTIMAITGTRWIRRMAGGWPVAAAARPGGTCAPRRRPVQVADGAGRWATSPRLKATRLADARPQHSVCPRAGCQSAIICRCSSWPRRPRLTEAIAGASPSLAHCAGWHCRRSCPN